MDFDIGVKENFPWDTADYFPCDSIESSQWQYFNIFF